MRQPLNRHSDNRRNKRQRRWRRGMAREHSRPTSGETRVRALNYFNTFQVQQTIGPHRAGWGPAVRAPGQARGRPPRWESRPGASRGPDDGVSRPSVAVAADGVKRNREDWVPRRSVSAFGARVRFQHRSAPMEVLGAERSFCRDFFCELDNMGMPGTRVASTLAPPSPIASTR